MISDLTLNGSGPQSLYIEEERAALIRRRKR
jgi:hypothetical protein